MQQDIQQFDVVVIGAGPGGYVAAINSAQSGFKTACIDGFIRNEKYSLGGTCLNVGCIPSKALLQSSENFAELTHSFADHGITCDNPKIDLLKMIDRKNDIIDKNSNGISFLFKKHKVTELHGLAEITKQENNMWIINIKDNMNGVNLVQQISATHVIIATGSIPRQLPQIPTDNINILDNQGALDLQEAPKQLCIIGAGVIGLEMASVWKRLGSDVIILEAQDKFLAQADEQVAKEALKAFTKQGIKIKTGVKIGAINNFDNNVVINYEENGRAEQITCDKLLVSIGRIPNTKNIVSEYVDLKFDDRGFIIVDERCQTNLTNVWAIGDCVRGPMLAHKASMEGSNVIERIKGENPNFDFNTVPWIIYTNPEIAWVGKTEWQLNNEQTPYKKGVANFMPNGRALAMGANVGFVKILACAETDRILGVHMVGPFTSELIGEAVVAMEFMASSEDLARIIHAHPTLSEVTHEAAVECYTH